MGNSFERNIEKATQVGLGQLEVLRDAHKVLENKVSILVGVEGIILAQSIIFLTTNIHYFGFNLFTLGLATLITSFTELILAASPMSIAEGVSFEILNNLKLLGSSEKDYDSSIASNPQKAYKENYKANQLKAKKVKIAAQLLVIAIYLLLLGVLYANRGDIRL